MSGKELASARSYWKRRILRDGRRSRYVEVEEVSLETVQAEAVENGLVDEVVSVLGTGKEANVYLGLWKGSPLALKVYRLHRTPHKKKAVIGYSPDRVGVIAAKEFTILEKAYRAGVPVPTPAWRVDNMFTMRFLGGEVRASLLKDSVLSDPELYAQEALGIIGKLLDAFIIHADLSEFNLLLYKDRLFVIDFPQAVDLSSRVNRYSRFEEAKPFLLRDLRNIARYFTKFNTQVDAEKEYDQLIAKFERQYL